MAYSVNWITKVISVPTSDLTLVSGTHYSLPMFDFLTEIRRLEWETTEGLWAPQILDHSDTRIDFAGSNYAAFDEMINGYTWQVTGVADRVDLLDSNNNLIDTLIVTGVSVVPSNSTGLTYSKQTQDIAFADARIWVNTTTGTAGATYPTGTPGQPCLSFNDAAQVAAVRGLPNRYRGVGTEAVTAGSLDGFDLLGASPDLSIFSIGSGVSTEGLVLESVFISGTFDGRVSMTGCETGALTNFSGTMTDCSWTDTIQIDSSATKKIAMHKCNSDKAGVARPELDVNGVVADVVMDRYSGGVEVTNMTGGNSMTINCSPASVRIAASCTSGTIKIRGDFAINNLAAANPGLTVLIYENDESSKYERMEKIWTREAMNPDTPNTYADDGSQITNDEFTLTRTDNGDGTYTVTRS